MHLAAGEHDKNAILEQLDKYPFELLLEAVLAKFGPLGKGDFQLKEKLAVLNALISLNDRVAENIAPHKWSRLPRNITVSAVHATLSAPEFHAIEYTSYGPPTRWTGPSHHFSFDIFVDRSVALDFVLEFETVYFVSSLKEFKCFIDGEEIELSIEQGGGGYLASGVLPMRQAEGASVVTFVCPDMKSPRENNLPDDRLLGVRFRRLMVNERIPAASGDEQPKLIETGERPVQEKSAPE